MHKVQPVLSLEREILPKRQYSSVGRSVLVTLKLLVDYSQVVTAHQFCPPLVVFTTGVALFVQFEEVNMLAALV